MSDASVKQRRASLYTLGCRLNQADTGLMADDLRRHGYEIVPWGQEADLLVVNGCAVTGSATQKTGQSVRAARRRFPEAFIVLAGCPVDVGTEEWERQTAADLLLANPGKTKLTAALPESLTRPDHPTVPLCSPGEKNEGFSEDGCGYYPERTRANLKIQEGCDLSCSYCIVPKARGPARSRQWNDVLRESRELLANGHREIVLTGVNIATYLDHGRDLAELLEEICSLPGEFRVRLSSTEPGPVLHRIVDLMAQTPRICRFLHLPIQYGDDRILQLMNRRYSVGEFRGFVQHAIGSVPGVCVGSDVIVGFPGETDGMFEQCVRTIEQLQCHYLHVFTYSKRPGTNAADMPDQVPGSIAGARHRRLSDVGSRLSMVFAEGSVGKELVVLTESRTGETSVEGWSDNYLRAEIHDPKGSIRLNEFVTVRVSACVSGGRVSGTIAE